MAKLVCPICGKQFYRRPSYISKRGSECCCSRICAEAYKKLLDKNISRQDIFKSLTKFRQSWGRMIERCTNKDHRSYKYYGGRGISVCKRWLDYENFKMDMFTSYKEGFSLDRIDNDCGYNKDNCRWVPKNRQASHTRRSCIIEYDGKKQNLSDWARQLGIKRSTLAQRYYVYNWNIEKCLNFKR